MRRKRKKRKIRAETFKPTHLFCVVRLNYYFRARNRITLVILFSLSLSLLRHANFFLFFFCGPHDGRPSEVGRGSNSPQKMLAPGQEKKWGRENGLEDAEKHV